MDPPSGLGPSLEEAAPCRGTREGGVAGRAGVTRDRRGKTCAHKCQSRAPIQFAPNSQKLLEHAGPTAKLRREIESRTDPVAVERPNHYMPREI